MSTLQDFKRALIDAPDHAPVRVEINGTTLALTGDDFYPFFGITHAPLYQVWPIIDGLRLRSDYHIDPNDPTHNVKRNLTVNDVLYVMEVLPGVIDGHSWLAVFTADGTPGYVAKELTSTVHVPVHRLEHPVGVHCLQDATNQSQALMNALPPNYTLNCVTVLNQASLAQWWSTRAAYVIFRIATGDANLDNPVIPTNPSEALAYGKQWVDTRLSQIHELNLLTASNVYFQLANEVKYAPGHDAFWRGVMQELEARGLKAAIGAYAVGQPEVEEWQMLTLALQYASLNGHIVCLHAYCADGTPPGQLSEPKDRPFYELRFPRLYDSVVQSARPPLIISEFGGEFHTGQFLGEGALISLVDAYRQATMDYPYLQGFCLYTLGSIGGWGGSSIDSAIPALAHYLSQKDAPLSPKYVIDLSHYNEQMPDSAILSRAGVVGIIHKATQGLTYVDPSYNPRHNGLYYPPNNPLYWGAYHFGDGTDGVAQANHFLDTIYPPAGILVALDWERNPDGPTMSLAQAEAFVQRVHDRLNRWPVLYTSAGFAGPLLPPGYSGVLTFCPLWIAAYGEHPAPLAPFPTWTLWQYTDGQIAFQQPRRLPGLENSDIDISIFNGPVENLLKWWGK